MRGFRSWRIKSGVDCRLAFTLVELLVAISIIGIVIALLIPAVQYSREAARRTQCKANLKQLALASLQHEQVHRHFPTGGWGWRWHGDPDRGFGREQPGGWAYNVLPYLEQAHARRAGFGQDMAAKRRVGRELAETPLAVFVCPSRRTAAAHPFVHPVDFHNIDRPTVVARSDYAANAGDQAPNVERRNGARGPESLAEGDDPRYKWNELNRTGVVFRRSQIAAAHITDGLGFTYLVAEKYLQRSEYSSGTAQNDDQTLYVGYDSDTLRVTDSGFPPRRDSRVQSDQAFGSPHSNAFHAAFCDGSVHLLSYRLSLFTHQWLGNRRDGKHVDVLAP